MLEKEQRRKQYGLNNSGTMSYIKPIDTRGISSGISRSNADTIEIKSIADTRFNNTDTRYNNTDTTTIDLENNTPLPSLPLLPALLMKRSPLPKRLKCIKTGTVSASCRSRCPTWWRYYRDRETGQNYGNA